MSSDAVLCGAWLKKLYEDVVRCSLTPQVHCLHQVIHIGDAFSGGWEVEGGFSGIVVDVFVDAAVHDDLLKVMMRRCVIYKALALSTRARVSEQRRTGPDLT
jgi:hypothetical protein